MSRLIHLNGPPGIGKSTLARRYAADHPGVLNCDIDGLRTLIGGWDRDFEGAGALIRPAALAMIAAYLSNGHDVVLPQMLSSLDEIERFEACAVGVDAQFVERMLIGSPSTAVTRFHSRGTTSPVDPWHDEVRAVVAANGGDTELARCHEALERLVQERPGAVVVSDADGSIEATYRALTASLR